MLARALILCLSLAPSALGCGHASPLPPTEAKKSNQAVRISLGEGTSLVLADLTTGKRLISTRDQFVAALSPLDRRLRLGTEGEVSEAALLAHFAAQVRSFQRAQVERLARAAAHFREASERAQVSLDLPSEVSIVLTSGLEEAGAAEGVTYTRAGVIYINERALDEDPTFLLEHELFHVYSYHHPREREALYRALGFMPLAHPVVWPPEVEARRITQPEAPTTEHAIRVHAHGREVLAAYVSLYDPSFAGTGDFFQAVSTYYALLDPAAPEPHVAPADVALESYHALAGFFEQVGKNTGYLAGPEEIWADTLQLLLAAPERAHTSRLLDVLRDTLRAR